VFEKSYCSILGPISSIPVALLGSSVVKALNTLSSEIMIWLVAKVYLTWGINVAGSKDSKEKLIE